MFYKSTLRTLRCLTAHSDLVMSQEQQILFQHRIIRGFSAGMINHAALLMPAKLIQQETRSTFPIPLYQTMTTAKHIQFVLVITVAMLLLVYADSQMMRDRIKDL